MNSTSELLPVKGGYCISEETLTRTISKPAHYLRNPPAICINRRVFDQYGGRFTQIVVRDTATRKQYRISKLAALRLGYPATRGGFEEQQVIPMEAWNDPRNQIEATPFQPDLFSDPL